MTSRWIHAAAALLLCAGSLLAGCWDYRELENRALIVGMGIEELPSQKEGRDETRQYRVVLQVVEPSFSSGQGENVGGSGSNQASRGYINITIETFTIAQGFGLIPTRSDHIPNLSHLQVLVLGESTANRGIEDIYDFFARFPQMRRRTKVLVVKGPVTPYFEVDSAHEPSPAMYIADVLSNAQLSMMLPESNFGSMSVNFHAQNPYLLLKASMNPEKRIVIEEAAVFINHKMVGTIQREQLVYLSMLRGEFNQQTLEFPCVAGKKAGLQILRGNTRLKPSLSNGKPHVTFQVELETELMEYQCLGKSLDNPELIRNMERTYSRMLADKLRTTANELKNKYRHDLFHFLTRLKNYPKLYKPMRQNPKAFFGELTVDVQVDMKVRNLGNALYTPTPRRSN